MQFDELDRIMRQYEVADDHEYVSDMYLVIRVDGKGFTKFVDGLGLERPFSVPFHNIMLATTTFLMTEIGFDFIYGFTESDEISLLMRPDANVFGRKKRKLESITAGAASAKFTQLIQYPAIFDSRVSALPNTKRVVDYFRWRQEDAHRNGLNTLCYWTLRQEGLTSRQASRMLENKGVAAKNELLFERGINYAHCPGWQQHGAGLFFYTYNKQGFNPKLNQAVHVERTDLWIENDLPYGDDYGRMIDNIVTHYNVYGKPDYRHNILSFKESENE